MVSAARATVATACKDRKRIPSGTSTSASKPNRYTAFPATETAKRVSRRPRGNTKATATPGHSDCLSRSPHSKNRQVEWCMPTMELRDVSVDVSVDVMGSWGRADRRNRGFRAKHGTTHRAPDGATRWGAAAAVTPCAWCPSPAPALTALSHIFPYMGLFLRSEHA
jgi:hypothetical protein